MKDEQDFRMTDLEERLTSSEGAALKTEILNRLAASGEEITAKIKAGLPPDEFEKAQALYEALAAAHEIVSVFPVNTQPTT
ncbi:MAG: EscE/YscE/SsaE family type III secretion system needle protein co-chaperone [Pseudomonadota bacterium]